MAVYKVIQDIEAEDKLIGPLGLKGFIYAVISLGSAFIDFRLLFATALGPARWVVMLVFLVPMVLFAVLASPLGREQPTEVWLLARIKFLFKPRKRVWDQTGISQLVTITAPKKAVEMRVKDINQTEVKSRLQTLAATLDSRGWVVKNSAVNLEVAPSYQTSAPDDSERLVASQDVTPKTAETVDIHESDDILDEQNNTAAQKMDSLVQQAEEDRKAALQERLQAAKTEAMFAATVQPGQTEASSAKGPLTSQEQSLLEQVHQRDQKLSDEHVIRGPRAGIVTPVTAAGQTGKLELAQSGNDLSVATIASLANYNGGQQPA